MLPCGLAPAREQQREDEERRKTKVTTADTGHVDGQCVEEKPEQKLPKKGNKLLKKKTVEKRRSKKERSVVLDDGPSTSTPPSSFFCFSFWFTSYGLAQTVR